MYVSLYKYTQNTFLKISILNFKNVNKNLCRRNILKTQRAWILFEIALKEKTSTEL